MTSSSIPASKKGLMPITSKLTWSQLFDIIRALLKRNYILWSRFKVSFFISIFSAIIGLATFFFINFALALDQNPSNMFGPGGFFRYVLLGMTISSFAGVSLSFYIGFLRSTYFSNWLEMILSSPMKLSMYFSISLIWSYILSTINILLYLLIGKYLFGVDLSIPVHFWLVIPIIFLMVIAILGIGLMAASMFLLYDVKGTQEPISWFFSTFAGLVSGMMFPVSLLQDKALPLYYLSRIFPHTYALDAFRRVMDNLGPEDSLILNDIVLLVVFCLILVPLGLLMFRLGIKKAEKTGKLARWGA